MSLLWELLSQRCKPASKANQSSRYSILALPQNSCFQILTTPGISEGTLVFTHTHTRVHLALGKAWAVENPKVFLIHLSWKTCATPKLTLVIRSFHQPGNIFLPSPYRSSAPSGPYRCPQSALLTSIVDSITVEDVIMAFPDEAIPN